MTVQFEKNDASQVSNKTLDIGNAKVELPSWCEMQTGPCDTSKTVMIQVNIFMLQLTALDAYSYI